jgi:5-methyltetrahydropteroyltriglutamate--homocysteine methyltransferase
MSAAVRTTVVGSWWVPPAHEEDLARYHRGELDAERGEEILRGAAAVAIAEQRDLGLDQWTGGEYFTHNFIYHLHKSLTGIEIDKEEAEEPFDYDDQTHARIVGEIRAPHGLGYSAAFKRENALPGGVKKATVVSPWEVIVSAFDQREAIEAQTETLTAIVNRELRELADAGCEHVQLDAPFFGVLVNQGQMEPERAAALIAACLEGVEATRGIHICNGNLFGRPNSAVLGCGRWVEILQHLDGVVDVPHLECKYFAQWLERDAFADLPASMQLAVGLVDEANYKVEPVSKLKSRIADWAEVVGGDRLWIAPSCGFGRHPARDIPILRAKVENMVEAAGSF